MRLSSAQTTGIRISLVLTLVGGFLFLAGCESKEDSQIAKAQQCLDTASTAAHGDMCYAMVASLTSERAYMIKCASRFVANGFIGDRVINAFKDIKKGNGTTNPMVTTLGYMAFTSMTAAEATLSECTASRVLSLERMATIVNMSTLIATSVGTTIPTEGMSTDDMKNAIDNFIASAGDEAEEQLGAIAVQAHTSFCNAGSAFATNEVCLTLGAAVETGDIQAIGQQLIAQLQTIH